MEETQVVDLLTFVALWGSLSPLAVSLLKNIGGQWHEGGKQAAALVLAVAGSVIGVFAAQGWSTPDFASWDSFWSPLLVGFVAIFPIQYTLYKGMWKGTKLETTLADVGTVEKVA